MAENDQVTLNETLTEDIARSHIIDKVLKLNSSSFRYGHITTIIEGPTDSPENTTVKVQEDDGDEYNFTGPKAYDAVTKKYRRVVKYQYVHFFAKEDTKEIMAIFMKCISGWVCFHRMEISVSWSSSNTVRG